MRRPMRMPRPISSPASPASCSKPIPPTTSARPPCTRWSATISPFSKWARPPPLRCAKHCSQLMEVLDAAMLAKPDHWRKHYPGTTQQQRLMRRYGLSDRCRYYWGEPAVAAALQSLFANLDAIDIPLPLLSQHLPDEYLEILQGQLGTGARALVEHKIGRVLAQYARACNRNVARPALDHQVSIC